MTNWVTLLCNSKVALQQFLEKEMSQPRMCTHKTASLANQLFDHSQKLDGEKIMMNIIAFALHMSYLLTV